MRARKESFIALQHRTDCFDRCFEFAPLELTHLLAHPIVSQGSQEGVPDGSPLEIPGGVPA